VKDRLDTSAFQLSGGQQQRLCISRALAVEPQVILMDEPTSSLDPVSSKKIEDLLTDLRDVYGITVLIVTHNVHQAEESGRSHFIPLHGGTPRRWKSRRCIREPRPRKDKKIHRRRIMMRIQNNY